MFRNNQEIKSENKWTCKNYKIENWKLIVTASKLINWKYKNKNATGPWIKIPLEFSDKSMKDAIDNSLKNWDWISSIKETLYKNLWIDINEFSFDFETINPDNLFEVKKHYYVWFASNNQWKIKIVENRFKSFWMNITVYCLNDFWIESPVEDWWIIQLNAVIKYNRFANANLNNHPLLKKILNYQKVFPIFSNDSWIFIDYYDWFWAESRRDENWKYLEDKDVAEKIQFVANNLPENKRWAEIQSCHVTWIYWEKFENVSTSIIRWKILESSSSKVEKNMPFNSVFVPEGYSKSISEMTIQEEINFRNNESSALERMNLIKSKLI